MSRPAVAITELKWFCFLINLKEMLTGYYWLQKHKFIFSRFCNSTVPAGCTCFGDRGYRLVLHLSYWQ